MLLIVILQGAVRKKNSFLRCLLLQGLGVYSLLFMRHRQQCLRPAFCFSLLGEGTAFGIFLGFVCLFPINKMQWQC